MLAGAARLLRHWKILLGAPIAAALIALAIMTGRPERFTAVSTVVVVPPTVTTSLASPVPTVEAFHQLATSNYVLDRVVEELRKEAVLAADEDAGAFRAELRQSGNTANPYLSLINLNVTTATPAKAQAAANAWAEVLVAEERAIATKGVAFILEELPKATESYEQVERQMQGIVERHAHELAAVQSRTVVPLQTVRVGSIDASVVQIEQVLNSVRIDRTRFAAEVEQLTRELAQTKPIIALSRSLTDESLWRAVDGAALSPELLAARIGDEEVNPVHTELSQRLANARVNLHAADAQVERLGEQLKGAIAEATAARAALAQGEMDLALTTKRHEYELAEQTRTLDQTKNRFTFLASKVGEAEVATAAQDSVLRIGGLALSAPPSGLSAAQAAMIAFVSTLAMALAAVWLIEYFDPRRAS